MMPEDKENNHFIPAWLASIALSKVKLRHRPLQEAFLETLPHQESRLVSVPLGAHCAQCFPSGNTSSLRAELDSSSEHHSLAQGGCCEAICHLGG